MSGKAAVAILIVVLAGCSDNKPKAEEKKGPPRATPVLATAENAKNPLAKYLEVSGLRMSEKAGGKLTVKVAVVNHSQAEISDVALEVTTPACTLPIKVGSLMPEEVKDSSGECTTTMRVYELPDWQFVRPTFKITSPGE